LNHRYRKVIHEFITIINTK